MKEDIETIARIICGILSNAKSCDCMIYYVLVDLINGSPLNDGNLKQVEKALNDISISTSIAARLIKQQRQRQREG